MKLKLKEIIFAASLVFAPLQANAAVSWNADATGALSFQEAITSNGGGSWTYSYSMTNLAAVDSSGWAGAVWFVGLFTNLSMSNFTGFNGWGATDPGLPTSYVDVAYDPMAAPGGQLNLAYSFSPDYYNSWPNGVIGIQQGQTLSGFSFTSSAYDNSQKQFIAYAGSDDLNTLGYNGSGNQHFSYGGWTTVAAVPEPETYAMLLAGFGMLGVARRRRKNLAA